MTQPAVVSGSQPGGATTVAAPAPPAERPADEPGQAGWSASAATDGQAVRPTSGLAHLTRILGTIVAPTTLLTSVLFYFGWMHAYWFFNYFGVNSTLLGLTTEDYLMRALDGLWVPMTVVACAGLVVLWGHAVLRGRLATISAGVLRALVAAMAVFGLILAVAGLSSVFAVEATVLERPLYGTLPPISLALGVLLLMYAVHLWRSLAAEEAAPGPRRPPWVGVAEWAGVFVLVGLSLFWAATNYAKAVGTGRAHEHVRTLAAQPNVAVFSSQSLSLRAPGVRELRCQDPEASYRFRYDGLKLILESGDQYVFLPARWSPTDGIAVLLPRNDSVRLEFYPSSAVATAQRLTC
jgi:hypothetical protein